MEHKWYMISEDETYVYETNNDKRTIYRRLKHFHPTTDDIKREIVLGVRDLGIIIDGKVFQLNQYGYE